jgi:2-phospho-L-lactate/phosphoenolpyruvate guanylyltransferase
VQATAIIPVKRFAAAKRRLADSLPAGRREVLVEAMLTDVLDALARCERLERIMLVTGEPRAERLARERGIGLLGDELDAGHPEAAAAGLAAARRAGCRLAALLPGDCPLLDPRELDAALQGAAAAGGPAGPGAVAIVPDRHGSGTNALLLAPADAIGPAFGPGSRARHERRARAAGIEPRIERLRSLALDLDTPADLEALKAELAGAPERAPATAAALAGQRPRAAGTAR